MGSFCKRPVLDILQSKTVEQSRGMKVRSSVKRLCDGCKVRGSLPTAIAYLFEIAEPVLFGCTRI